VKQGRSPWRLDDGGPAVSSHAGGEVKFVVETDACDTGISAVLSQEGHPIAYFNKGLIISNKKISTYEKEFLAMLMVVDK
jgi:hypothetical protein